MASAAIVLKTKQRLSNDEFAVALRVTHDRISKYYTASHITRYFHAPRTTTQGQKGYNLGKRKFAWLNEELND